MRFQPLILILGFLAGCARDDTRLHGEWRSNRDATVAAAFQRDPRWTNAAPEKVERFRDMFGHMTVIYSNGMATSSFRQLWLDGGLIRDNGDIVSPVRIKAFRHEFTRPFFVSRSIAAAPLPHRELA